MSFETQPFYHGTIKRAIVAFGNLFTGLTVVNKDPSGDAPKVTVCPISYAKKQQWFQRLSTDPDFANMFETTLPRLSFEVVDYSYNSGKKVGGQHDSVLVNCGVPKNLFSPVPYRITLQLYSYTKNQEDSLQIIEQILPYFSPSLTLNIELLSDINVSMDIPLVLNGVSTEDNSDDLESNRMIINTFTFTMDVQLFGPYDTSKVTVIKKAIVDVNTSTTFEEVGERYTVEVNPRSANKSDEYTLDEMWDPIT